MRHQESELQIRVRVRARVRVRVRVRVLKSGTLGFGLVCLLRHFLTAGEAGLTFPRDLSYGK